MERLQLVAGSGVVGSALTQWGPIVCRHVIGCLPQGQSPRSAERDFRDLNLGSKEWGRGVST